MYMAISPILLNATIQQTNEVLQNQTRETHKAAVDQGNIYVQEQKHEHDKATKVMDADKAIMYEERFDAKEKGKGSYQGDGGKKRKPQDNKKKSMERPEGGFDIKI